MPNYRDRQPHNPSDIPKMLADTSVKWNLFCDPENRQKNELMEKRGKNRFSYQISIDFHSKFSTNTSSDETQFRENTWKLQISEIIYSFWISKWDHLIVTLA